MNTAHTQPNTTLSSKFQISLPKAVREAKGWQPGQRFVFMPSGAGVLMVPAPTLMELSGIAKGANPDFQRDRADRY